MWLILSFYFISKSGDVDGRVPLIGTRDCVEALNLTLKSPWHSWFLNKQVSSSCNFRLRKIKLQPNRKLCFNMKMLTPFFVSLTVPYPHFPLRELENLVGLY